MNILDLMKEQAMAKQTKAPVMVQEVAQFHIIYRTPQNPTILRFGSMKKAKAEYYKLKKAWAKWRDMDEGSMLVDLDGDMFIATVDLTQIAAIAFVDVAIRQNFEPFAG